jgi:hypothetical protein
MEKFKSDGEKWKGGTNTKFIKMYEEAVVAYFKV